MFQCFNVACGARGNVRSCGTSRAHSACDTQDTLLWGHMALIRTPGIPWLMRSLVSCDNPYPLLSLENTRISETTTRPHEEHLLKTQDLRQGLGLGRVAMIIRRNERRKGRKWKKVGKDYISSRLGQIWTQKLPEMRRSIYLSNSTKSHLKTGTNEVFN